MVVRICVPWVGAAAVVVEHDLFGVKAWRDVLVGVLPLCDLVLNNDVLEIVAESGLGLMVCCVEDGRGGV